jgi:hypothetical protein
MAKYKTNVVYHWTSPDNDDELFFVSPDGLGRVFYASTYEAVFQTGITNILRIHELED